MTIRFISILRLVQQFLSALYDSYFYVQKITDWGRYNLIIRMITFPPATYLIAWQIGVEFVRLGVVYKNDLVAQFVNDFGCGRWMDHMEMCYSFEVSGFDKKTVCAAAEVTWSSITAADQ